MYDTNNSFIIRCRLKGVCTMRMIFEKTICEYISENVVQNTTHCVYSG